MQNRQLWPYPTSLAVLSALCFQDGDRSGEKARRSRGRKRATPPRGKEPLGPHAMDLTTRPNVVHERFLGHQAGDRSCNA
jgi:hypothetical protein